MQSHSGSSRVTALLRRSIPGTIKQQLRERSRMAMARAGYLIIKADDESLRYMSATHNEAEPLPPGAEDYLRPDNPALLQLQQAYDRLDIPAAAHTQWDASYLKRDLAMAWFRGDNAYVWQFRQFGSGARLRTYLSLLDIESRDHLGLLGKLTEDGLFGAWTFEFGDRPLISRDLLDSVNEINYLDAHAGIGRIEGLRVLDIGAGYGRLAHRMSTALPNLAAYDCIDGVATSTFLCDYYRRFRDLPSSVRVVALPDHESLADRYDLAVNIHSFSECSYAAIEWWMARIAERQIEWLLIIPNTLAELLSTERESHRNFMPLVEAAGYSLVDSRPIHESDELRSLIDIQYRFYLFRRNAH